MTMTTFDRNSLTALRAEIDAALALINAKHGIALSIGKITYDHTMTEFTTKLTGKAAGSEGREAQEAIAHAKRMFLVDASQPSTHPKATGAKLISYRSRAGLRPWVYEQDGKTYVTTDGGLKQMWPAVTHESPIG